MARDNRPLIPMYKMLCGTRIAEQAIIDLTREGVITAHHSGLGHESIGVAVGMAVRPDDGVQPSHRSGMMVAHARGGFSLREAILAKAGLARSFAAPTAPHKPRFLMTVGLVGSQTPLSVGIAMADRLKGKDTVHVTFFGDGAANEGAVHEAMNLAGARKLPMVFLVENNGMSISVPVEDATGAESYASRAAGYGMAGTLVDGQDPIAVYEAVQAAVDRARRGDGPSVVEAKMLRWEAHTVSMSDTRSKEDLAKAREKDGVADLRRTILDLGMIMETDLAALEAECRAEVEAAVAEVRSAPKPPPAAVEPFSAADAWHQTYAD